MIWVFAFFHYFCFNLKKHFWETPKFLLSTIIFFLFKALEIIILTNDKYSFILLRFLMLRSNPNVFVLLPRYLQKLFLMHSLSQSLELLIGFLPLGVSWGILLTTDFCFLFLRKTVKHYIKVIQRFQSFQMCF